jgi:hypothetical protein
MEKNMRVSFLLSAVLITTFGFNTLAKDVSPQAADSSALIKALKSDDVNQVRAAAEALCRKNDVNAAGEVIPLLKSKNPAIRLTAVHTLGCLITAEGIDAVDALSASSKDPNEVKECERFLDWAMATMKLSRIDWTFRKPEVKKEIVARILKGQKFYF